MSTLGGQAVTLTEAESRRRLEQYGIAQNRYRVASSPGEAAQAAEELGYPVAMKILSPRIIHKSDFGGVRLGLKTATEVSTAYDEMVSAAVQKGVSLTEIQGVTVQEMATGVAEAFIGARRDRTFGVVVLVGTGGIWVEVLRDVELGIWPLEESEIDAMIRRLKGHPLLDGFRGRPRADVSALVQLVRGVGAALAGDPEILELDLNPVLVKALGDGAVAVDARIVVAGK